MARQHGTRIGRRKAVRGTGFARAADAAAAVVESGGAARGFAERSILTGWADIVGAEFAARCRPLQMTYRGREPGLGATLVVLVEGALAAEVAHDAARIVERVNRTCGHRAVARLKLVQTHGLATGMLAEAGAPWQGAPPVDGPPVDAPPVDAPPSPGVSAIADDGLREALARLERNIRRRASNPAAAPRTRGQDA